MRRRVLPRRGGHALGKKGHSWRPTGSRAAVQRPVRFFGEETLHRLGPWVPRACGGRVHSLGLDRSSPASGEAAASRAAGSNENEAAAQSGDRALHGLVNHSAHHRRGKNGSRDGTTEQRLPNTARPQHTRGRAARRSGPAAVRPDTDATRRATPPALRQQGAALTAPRTRTSRLSWLLQRHPKYLHNWHEWYLNGLTRL